MGTKPWSEIRRRIIRTPEEEARVTRMVSAGGIAHRLGQLRELPIAPGTTRHLEHPADTFLTTLRSYVEDLGGVLDIRAVFPDEAIAIVPTDDEVLRGVVVPATDAATTTIVMRYEYAPEVDAWSAVGDTPGCATFGSTLTEAHAQARDAVATWLELPDERSLEDAGVAIIDVIE